MAKILIVEDDSDISDFVVEKFVQNRHAADVAANGVDAMAFLDAYPYDLVVLDINIPPPNGIEILKYVRNKYKQTKVLMLTNQQEVEDKLRGFDAGADDYLGKPFDVRELLARVQALLSRPAQVVETVLTWGDLTLNSLKFEIYRGNEQIKLQKKDFMLLEFLMRHPAEAFPTEAIINRIFDADSKATTEGVRVSINRIRNAIDLPDGQNSIIETVTRVGYRIGKV